MPRFYFHISHGGTSLDSDGFDFPDLDAAKDEAIRCSGEMLRGLKHGPEFWSGTPWRLWVTDQPNGEGRVVFTLEFAAK